MMRKLASKVFRRGSRTAKGREETSSTEYNLARLRAELNRDVIREHVKKCLKEDKDYRLEELFVVYEDLSSNEQKGFRALHEKFKRSASPEWWKEFDDLWVRLWSTGSVSEKLKERNGWNPHDDTLTGVVEVKPKHVLIAEFEKEMDIGPLQSFDHINLGFFDEHKVLYYMKPKQQDILRDLYAKRADSFEDRRKWDRAWARFCMSMEDLGDPTF